VIRLGKVEQNVGLIFYLLELVKLGSIVSGYGLQDGLLSFDDL
jgi:hypothetical protein